MFVSNILSLVALFLVPTISWVESQTLWLLKASLCSSATSWLFAPVLFGAEHFMYTGVVKTFFFRRRQLPVATNDAIRAVSVKQKVKSCG